MFIQKRWLFVLIVSLSLVFGCFFYKNFVLKEETQKIEEAEKLEISAGVVPHHLLADQLINNFFKELSNYSSSLKTVILFSPDHYNQTALTGGHFITVSPKTDIEQETKLPEIISVLTKNSLVKVNNFSVSQDQGVMNLMPFFQKYLPKIEVVPILISSLTTKEEIKELVDELNKIISENTIFLASVDFSHYLPSSLLLLHDVKSIRTLLNFDEEEFQNLDVDSWQALYAIRYFAQLKQMEEPKIIGHKTNYDFIESLPENSLLNKEGGVSYYSVIFKEGIQQKISQNSILFVGDIMMARGVSQLLDKYGLDYPFKKIKNIFRGIDIVYGNLEGPVMANAAPVSLYSVNFAYPPDIVELLKNLGFTVLNIANNHIKDKGNQGLEETRKYLKENEIFSLGDYQSCDSKYYFQQNNLILIGANLTYGNNDCVEEILENVEKLQKENPNLYIIVTPHWGKEYTPFPTEFQKNTSHNFIDKGVDAIIGHHSHVVQLVEEYKGKPIFYSLGNFVFDMYFSKEVQQELAVGMEINSKEVNFYLIPIKSEKSQLSLMNGDETLDFLTWLAEISSPSLEDSIQNGMIKINLTKLKI